MILKSYFQFWVIMALIVQFLCPFGYDNTFSSVAGVPIILGTGIIVSIGVSFIVRGTRKVAIKTIASNRI